MARARIALVGSVKRSIGLTSHDSWRLMRRNPRRDFVCAGDVFCSQCYRAVNINLYQSRQPLDSGKTNREIEVMHEMHAGIDKN